MEVLDVDKENCQISLNNNGKSKLPYAVESLLLLDNTLLCNIEPDNESHVFSEICKPLREFNEMPQASKEQVQSIVTTSSEVSSSVSSKMDDWQDKTLMNEIFAQFDSQTEEIVPESCNNISSFDIFDTFDKEDTNSELGNVDKNVEKASLDQLCKNILHQDELMNVSCLHITNFGDDTLEDGFFKKDDKDGSPILKTKSRILNECKILKKKTRLNNVSTSKGIENKTDSTNYSSFYGLSSNVKKLIQEIKGICELYRKFTIIN